MAITTGPINATAWAYKNWQSSSTEINDESNIYVGTSDSQHYYTRLYFPSFWSSIGVAFGTKSYRIRDLKLFLYSNSGFRFNTYTYCRATAAWEASGTGDAMVSTVIGDAGTDEIWDSYQGITGLGDAILSYNSGFYIYIRPQTLPAPDRVQLKTKKAGSAYTSLHPRLVYTYEENSNFIYKNGVWQPILGIQKYSNNAWTTVSSITKY